MKTDKWIGFDFEKNGWAEWHENHSEAWDKFLRDTRSDLRRMAKEVGWELHQLRGNWFTASGFFYHKELNKWVYISIPDVRHWQDEWYKQVLMRTAKNNTDWTGGMNRFFPLREVGIALQMFESR